MQKITFKEMQEIAINGLAFIGATPNTSIDLVQIFERLTNENVLQEKIACTATSTGFTRGTSRYYKNAGDKFYVNDTHLVIHSPAADTYICYSMQ